MADLAKLSPRHHHMAYMVAAGKGTGEIARILGYTESRVSVIRSSPLFQVMVGQIQREMGARAIDDIVEAITAEGPESVARLRELRNQSDDLGVAFRAASYFLDKNPKVAAIKAAAEAGVTLLLDAAVMQRANRAIAEAEGRVVDMEDAPLTPAFGGLKTLDEAIAEAASRGD